MANYKMCGVIESIDTPVVKDSFSCQSFLLRVDTKNGNAIYYPFTAFINALTTENMQHVVAGNTVTVSFFISSKEQTSSNGTNYYRLSLSVDRIEPGDTTDKVVASTQQNSAPVFAGAQAVGVSVAAVSVDANTQPTGGDYTPF